MMLISTIPPCLTAKGSPVWRGLGAEISQVPQERVAMPTVAAAAYAISSTECRPSVPPLSHQILHFWQPVHHVMNLGPAQGPGLHHGGQPQSSLALGSWRPPGASFHVPGGFPILHTLHTLHILFPSLTYPALHPTMPDRAT